MTVSAAEYADAGKTSIIATVDGVKVSGFACSVAGSVITLLGTGALYDQLATWIAVPNTPTTYSNTPPTPAAITIAASQVNSGSFSTVRLGGSAYGESDVMINGTVACSVASNILTVEIKTLAGTTPSVSDPVYIFCRDATLANGNYVGFAITNTLSITTVATGATFGTANSVPFSLYLVFFNNGGGTPMLGLWQSVTGGASPTAIAPLCEDILVSSTACSGSATAAGTFYTPSGQSVSSKPFRILARLDYASGLATAGSYASVPTTIHLAGPGMRLPGQVVQTVNKYSSTGISTTSTTYVDVTGATVSITPTRTTNLIRVGWSANLTSSNVAATNTTAYATLNEGSTVLQTQTCATVSGAGNIACQAGIGFGPILRAPGTTSSTTYKLQAKTSINTSAAICVETAGLVEEIQT